MARPSCILWACLLWIGPGFGSASSQEAPSNEVQASRIEGSDAPLVDGRLDDLVWDQAAPADAFFQREPQEGAPATERTEVLVLYDDEHLYLGVSCYDREPQKIAANEMRRDAGLDSDDSFAFVLDTFGDRRSALPGSAALPPVVTKMPIYAQYYVWLTATSLLCFLLERIAPWRPQQRALRRGIWQDLLWLVFNGHYLGLVLALVTGRAVALVNAALHRAGLPVPESLALLSGAPLWLQFVVLLVLKDFIEWNIHRLLHNVPWLWEFHKLHHSIEELDWIGNFRFHGGEVVVYKALSYLPLVVLGIDGSVILAIGVLWTLALDLNHANLPFAYGPLRYLLNSPRGRGA